MRLAKGVFFVCNEKSSIRYHFFLVNRIFGQLVGPCACGDEISGSIKNI